MNRAAGWWLLRVALATLASGVACEPVYSQENERRVTGDCARHLPQLDGFGGFVTRQMTERRIPGLTIGFFQEGCTWVAAYGFADLEARVPTRVESAYRYASVQKSMTAAAVLTLAERGEIDLDAPIQRYVPHFPAKPWPISVRQLLGHLGGIPHYVNRDAEQHITVHKTTREAVAIFAGFDLVAEPGTKLSYSSYGYNLLGAALEGVTGRPYDEVMRELVWGPLEMASVRLDDPYRLIDNRVRGYRLVEGELRNSEFIDVSSRFAAGGTRGTVPDLLRFLRGIVEGRLLGPASQRLAFEPMTTRDGSPTTFSAGWQVPNVRDRGRLVMNDGGQPETRTFILLDPDRRFGIAFAMNLEADIYAPIVLELYRLIAGHPLEFQGR